MHLVDERTAELKQANFRLQVATSQLKDANRDLTRLSTLDGLTGIPNRRMFDRTLEIEWQRALRAGKMCIRDSRRIALNDGEFAIKCRYKYGEGGCARVF